MKEWITSRNPIYEVLQARRRQPFRLRVAEGAEIKGRLAEILKLCEARRLPVERVPRSQLDRLAESHQGVALEVSAYPYAALQDILSEASKRQEQLFVLALDALQNPQNLGTLLRTAEAVGVHGVIIPLAHSAEITPAVVQASSGASEHLRIARANLAQSLATLKETGAWIIGLEGSPEAVPVEQAHLGGPLVVVVGSEGEGLRALVRKSCDLLVRLPMRGRVESLNAAVAGSVILYLALRARLS
ncbi:MAG: 23S rRNA (guanosine(2251)-2'-O)-methyltransferase RlmB [Anaerolineae bacterium]|nr:23S rRNA (guanosine(2251)-2'-O)-methyltransferase RlmB [Anaerolineae bacterium]